jgi:hypothetical protein
MVLFDLSTLRRMATDETVRGMFFLPQGTDLDPHSHIILTSRGTVAAEREGSRLVYPANGAVFRTGETEACLYRRFSERFDLVPVDELPAVPPVPLQLGGEGGGRRSEGRLRRRTLRAAFRATQGRRDRVSGGEPGGAVLRGPLP